jgi:very-short-patch-repair endonuclease
MKYFKLKLPFNPKLKDRARELRKAGNLAEVVLWQQIKNKQLNNLDFDRQKIIGNYIVDFFCQEHGLIIEINGSSHDNKLEYDIQRELYLKGFSLKVLNFTDKEVLNSLDLVVEEIKKQTTPSSASADATPS